MGGRPRTPTQGTGSTHPHPPQPKRCIRATTLPCPIHGDSLIVTMGGRPRTPTQGTGSTHPHPPQPKRCIRATTLPCPIHGDSFIVTMGGRPRTSTQGTGSTHPHPPQPKRCIRATTLPCPIHGDSFIVTMGGRPRTSTQGTGSTHPHPPPPITNGAEGAIGRTAGAPQASHQRPRASGSLPGPGLRHTTPHPLPLRAVSRTAGARNAGAPGCCPVNPGTQFTHSPFHQLTDSLTY